jgi:hypothetical protein
VSESLGLPRQEEKSIQRLFADMLARRDMTVLCRGCTS